MNLTIAFITLIVLGFGAYAQLKVWKTRALLSPGFYFSIIWGLGVVGLIVFESLDLLLDPYPKYIDELNIFVAYTSLCFTLLVKKGRNKIESNSIISINFLLSFNVFIGLSVLYFIISIYIFLTEGNGLNFAVARDNMHTTIENRSFLVGYIRVLSLPLAIYAGSRLVKLLSKKELISPITYFFLLLPFFSDTLFSFAEGGRVALAYSMLMYVVGGAISLPIIFDLNRYKRVFLNALVFFVVINMIISWVGSIRADADRNTPRVTLIKNTLGPFSFLYGAIEYVQVSYLGYQYRRDDVVNLNDLGYGVYTFNGFINWRLPFAARLGLENATLAHAFDVYYDNQETYDFGRDYYYVTHSAYIPLMKDFGNKGIFVALFFMVLFTHTLFVNIQKRKNLQYATTFFFFYLFFDYWTRSNFYGSLSESILVSLYSLVLVDFLNFVAKIFTRGN